MSFTHGFVEADPPASMWLCLCNTCGEEFDKEIEPDVDDEGRLVFHKPSECPTCHSQDITVETN